MLYVNFKPIVELLQMINCRANVEWTRSKGGNAKRKAQLSV